MDVSTLSNYVVAKPPGGGGGGGGGGAKVYAPPEVKS